MLSSTSFHRFSSITHGISKVANEVLWIGVNDWDLREFHSMETPIGTSYNSYLIQSSQPTIIDAVKYTLADEWISRLSSVYPNGLKEIKNIVLNHAEPDHSSGIVKLLEKAPHIKLILTQKNLDTISRFYNSSKWNVQIIQGGTPFEIGNKTLILAEVPMAHWPESGVTYFPEKKILFSNDAFGQHIATTKRFYDEIDPSLYYTEAKSYYANILMKHGKPVLNAIKKVAGLPGVDMVLPSHGVGFRRPEDIGKIIKLYTNWANQTPEKKISVIYDCNWFGTERMAHAIANGAGKLVEVNCLHARRTHITHIAADALDSAALAVGSSVLHDNVLPDLAMNLQYLRCLSVKNKLGALFGTYGWNPTVLPKEIRSQLFLPTKVKEVVEPFIVKWSPSEADLQKCEEIGKTIAESVIELLQQQK